MTKWTPKLKTEADGERRRLEDIHQSVLPMEINGGTALWLHCMDSEYEIFVSAYRFFF